VSIFFRLPRLSVIWRCAAHMALEYVSSQFQSQGVSASGDWLRRCIEYLERHGIRGEAPTLDHAWQQFLNTDIAGMGFGSVPRAIGDIVKGTLEGPFVLQVESVNDASESVLDVARRNTWLLETMAWKARLVSQAQALADYHDDLRRTDIEKELRHEQHVTALEREVVMLRASLQVAETTIQRLLQEATAQQMALRTLQDEAARLKTDMESCCQRQSQHDDDLRRQTERNAALLTTIDALAQERDQWMTQQHTRDSQAAATRDERVKSVAEQVVRLQCVVEALQRTMGDLQAENALLRQDNGGLTALLRQAQEPGGAVKLPMRLGGPALAPPKGQRSGLRSKCRKCSKCDCGVR